MGRFSELAIEIEEQELDMMIPRLNARSSTLTLITMAVLMVSSVTYAQPFENCPNPAGGNCSETTDGTPGCRFQSLARIGQRCSMLPSGSDLSLSWV